jgi:hypothetical protein
MDSPEPRLDYENLDVYQRSIELLHLAMQVTSGLPRGESELRSQLKTRIDVDTSQHR